MAALGEWPLLPCQPAARDSCTGGWCVGRLKEEAFARALDGLADGPEQVSHFTHFTHFTQTWGPTTCRAG
jgi:hypothetical protein